MIIFGVLLQMDILLKWIWDLDLDFHFPKMLGLTDLEVLR
jgi:hypothetical protein